MPTLRQKILAAKGDWKLEMQALRENPAARDYIDARTQEGPEGIKAAREFMIKHITAAKTSPPTQTPSLFSQATQVAKPSIEAASSLAGMFNSPNVSIPGAVKQVYNSTIPALADTVGTDFKSLTSAAPRLDIGPYANKTLANSYNTIIPTLQEFFSPRAAIEEMRNDIPSQITEALGSFTPGPPSQEQLPSNLLDKLLTLLKGRN